MLRPRAMAAPRRRHSYRIVSVVKWPGADERERASKVGTKVSLVRAGGCMRERGGGGAEG